MADEMPQKTMTFSLGDTTLRFHQWYLAHRQQLVKWWVILILVLDAGILFYNIGSLLIFFSQNNRYETLAMDLARNLRPAQVLAEQSVVQPEVVRTSVIPNQDRSDYLAQVKNSNTDWIAKLTFHFEVGTTSTEAASGFVLPGQTRYLALLGQAAADPNGGQAKCVFDDIRWVRVTDRARLDNTVFRVENLVVEPAAITPNTAKTFARISADIVNTSLYGYWQVDIPVVVLQNQMPVAIQNLILRSFAPGERRTITAQWLERLPAQSTADIQPVVDITDTANYMNE